MITKNFHQCIRFFQPMIYYLFLLCHLAYQSMTHLYPTDHLQYHQNLTLYHLVYYYHHLDHYHLYQSHLSHFHQHLLFSYCLQHHQPVNSAHQSCYCQSYQSIHLHFEVLFLQLIEVHPTHNQTSLNYHAICKTLFVYPNHHYQIQTIHQMHHQMIYCHQNLTIQTIFKTSLLYFSCIFTHPKCLSHHQYQNLTRQVSQHQCQTHHYLLNLSNGHCHYCHYLLICSLSDLLPVYCIQHCS